jgi:protein tyrosine/serine phosphatase
VLAALRMSAYREGATVVHCTAGKDRTGVVVALALADAGVERAAIVADYAASADHLRRADHAARRIGPQPRAVLRRGTQAPTEGAK